ncbi:MAG: M1 family metallopeptidase [Thermoanaerobaculia bacterium]
MGCKSLRLALLAFLAAGAAAGADADPTYLALRNARPDGKAVAVQQLVIERDVFRFKFETGTFQFLSPVDGRTFGTVFSGRATLEVRPASETERRFLAFVTDEKDLEVLTESLTSLVLLFGDGTADEIEKQGSPATPLADAASLYQAAFKKQRTDWKSNLQIRLLADALRPGKAGGAFFALFDGKKYPASLTAVDPEGLEWLLPGVGSEGAALAVLGRSQPQLWYCSKTKSPAEPSGGDADGRRALARHYTVETTIRKNEEIEATTTIRFEPLTEGLRVLPLRLLEKLRIREASLAPAESDAWTPIGFIQEAAKEDSDAAAVFPEPLAPGKEARIRIAYAGKDVLQDAGDGNFVVGARDSWYPNLGSFGGPVSFDLSYRCPKGYQIVSVGHLEEDRLDGDVRVLRFRQSRPVRVAGFNYGKFKKIERADADSGMTVSVYTNTGTPDFIRELNMIMENNRGAGLSHIPVDTAGFADAAMADGINMARVGSVYFGPLPEKSLALTQQTQVFFGQSWPSLVYLPFIAALDATVRHELGLQGASHFVDEVGPHEVAHQWWGHLVGWSNYHDQWLSEGLAEFSVSLVLQVVEGGKKFNPFWERARREILSRPRGSAAANVAAGPISLGWRLATERSPQAYQAMVYSKGAYVVHMLRMAMMQHGKPNPDAPFMAMMKDFVSTWSDKNPSTRDFQAVVERHMVPALDLTGDGKMDWFFRQWVYGTQIPRYESKVEITKVGEQYHLHGTVAQDGVSEGFRSVPHLYLELPRGEIAHIGTLRMTGKTTLPIDVTMRLPREPKRMILNFNHDVLSRD